MTSVSAIILAGGHSTRMGADKAMLPLRGKPLLQHAVNNLTEVADETIIVARPGQVLPKVYGRNLMRVDDLLPGRGPLGGIYTGLLESSFRRSVVVACDMPFVSPELVRYMLGQAGRYQAVMPISPEGRTEPLCAVYSTSAASVAGRLLDEGDWRAAGLRKALRTREILPEEWRKLDPEGMSFFNVNKREDLDRALTMFSLWNPVSPI